MKQTACYAVIMAGGRGERFWPQSRQNCPKQLLPLMGNLTLIEHSAERMLSIVTPERCLVITNQDYVEPIRSLLPMLPTENIIGEPCGRDTGGCLALATGLLRARGVLDDAVIIATPADHRIDDVPALARTLLECAAAAEHDSQNLYTIGIPISDTATGYGYICRGKTLPQRAKHAQFHQVEAFREKPTLKAAQEMMKDTEKWVWNSGIFVWQLQAFQNALQQSAPELASVIGKIAQCTDPATLQQCLQQNFQNVPNVSIDYAVLEKNQNLVVATGDFDWADVGSWSSLRDQIRPEQNGNVVRGLFAGLDTEHCIIVSDARHLIATIDVQDLIIVNNGNVTLICREKSAQRVKELVQKIDQDPNLKQFL